MFRGAVFFRSRCMYVIYVRVVLQNLISGKGFYFTTELCVQSVVRMCCYRVWLVTLVLVPGRCFPEVSG